LLLEASTLEAAVGLHTTERMPPLHLSHGLPATAAITIRPAGLRFFRRPVHHGDRVLD
jgi:hypothetical protein